MKDPTFGEDAMRALVTVEPFMHGRDYVRAGPFPGSRGVSTGRPRRSKGANSRLRRHDRASRRRRRRNALFLPNGVALDELRLSIEGSPKLLALVKERMSADELEASPSCRSKRLA